MISFLWQKKKKNQLVSEKFVFTFLVYIFRSFNYWVDVFNDQSEVGVTLHAKREIREENRKMQFKSKKKQKIEIGTINLYIFLDPVMCHVCYERMSLQRCLALRTLQMWSCAIVVLSINYLRYVGKLWVFFVIIIVGIKYML